MLEAAAPALSGARRGRRPALDQIHRTVGDGARDRFAGTRAAAAAARRLGGGAAGAAPARPRRDDAAARRAGVRSEKTAPRARQGQGPPRPLRRVERSPRGAPGGLLVAPGVARGVRAHPREAARPAAVFTRRRERRRRRRDNHRLLNKVLLLLLLLFVWLRRIDKK